MTLPGIEPTTFRLVTQDHSHLCHRHPRHRGALGKLIIQRPFQPMFFYRPGTGRANRYNVVCPNGAYFLEKLLRMRKPEFTGSCPADPT